MQQNVNSAANFVFTSKIGLPRVVLVLRWVLFVRQIFVSPHLEFEQHIHSSDPRPDTVREPWSCPIGFTAPSKASARTFKHLIPQLDGRKVKHYCRLRDHTHFFFFISLFVSCRPGSCQPICGSIANKSFSSAKAALVCSFRTSKMTTRRATSAIWRIFAELNNPIKRALSKMNLT